MLPTVRKWVQTELAKSTRKSQQAERLDRRKRHTDWRKLDTGQKVTRALNTSRHRIGAHLKKYRISYAG
jgi:ABC-type taurine transport system substrate-binding protein